MNSTSAPPKKIDTDLERQIGVSRMSVTLILCLALSWSGILLLFQDFAGAVFAGLVSYLYGICLLLLRLGSFHLARAFWLTVTSASLITAIMFAQPITDVDYIFLPISALLFLAFSWKHERKTMIFFVVLPLLLWFAAIQFSLIGSSFYYFGIPSISSNIDLAARNHYGTIDC